MSHFGRCRIGCRPSWAFEQQRRLVGALEARRPPNSSGGAASSLGRAGGGIQGGAASGSGGATSTSFAPRHLVLDCQYLLDLEVTTIAVMKELVEGAEQKGCVTILCGLDPTVSAIEGGTLSLPLLGSRQPL